MKRLIRVAPYLFFLALVCIFFYQTLLFGRLPIPSDTLVGLYHPWRDLYAEAYPRGVPFKNFLITDPVRQQIPWRKVAIDSWRRGAIPWWNPFTFSGASLIGNIQAGVFYPLNLLFFMFPFATAWTILIISQPLLSLILLYIYLRFHDIGRIPAVIGSIAWGFGGFSVAWLTWGTIMSTALWIPLELYAIDHLGVGRKRWWLLLACALTTSLFAGHAQIFLYNSIFVVAYAVLYKRAAKDPRVIREMLAAIGVFLVVSAVQWIPTLKALFFSSRISDEVWRAPGFFLPWQNLIQFIVPDFFGNPATLNYWGVWNYGEFIGYIGVTSLLFVFIALCTDWKRAKFWLGTVVISLLFMLPSPISYLPYQLHIPVLDVLQPTRLMVLVDLSLAVLVGLGVSSVTKQRKNLAIPILIPGLIIMVSWIVMYWGTHRGYQAEVISDFLIAKHNLVLPTILYVVSVLPFALLRWKRIRKWIVVALLCVTVIDLFRFGWKFTPFTPTSYFFPETQVTTFLEHQPKPFRVMSLDDRILPPNTLSYYGIETIEGYDPVYSGNYEEMIAALARGKADISRPFGFNRILTSKNVDSSLLPYFNVRYVLALQDVSRPFLKKVFQEGETRVYEYERALPRAYFADQVVREVSRQGVLQSLIDAKSMNIGVIENSSWQEYTDPVRIGEKISITAYDGQSIHMSAKSMRDRLVIVSNQYDSGWVVYIDNAGPYVVNRVNYAFSGFMVPAGTHSVVMSYRFMLLDE